MGLLEFQAMPSLRDVAHDGVHLVTNQPQTGASGVVRQGRWHGPSITTKSHPARSLSSSLTGGTACWTSPLAFGLIGRASVWVCRGWGCSTPLTLPHSISQLIMVVILQRRPWVGFQFRPCAEYSTTGGCLGVISSLPGYRLKKEYKLLLLTQFVLRESHPAEVEFNLGRYQVIQHRKLYRFSRLILLIQRWNSWTSI